jgi:hypothetical protein
MSHRAYFRVLKLPGGHWGFLDTYVTAGMHDGMGLEKVILPDGDPITVEAFNLWCSGKVTRQLSKIDSKHDMKRGETVTFPFIPSGEADLS